MKKLLTTLFASISFISYGQGHFPIGGANDTIDISNIKVKDKAYYDNIPSSLTQAAMPAWKHIDDSILSSYRKFSLSDYRGDHYEYLKNNSAVPINMYIRCTDSMPGYLRAIRVGVNYSNATTVEYRFLNDIDSFFNLRGVYVGSTEEFNPPTVALNGTFVTSSVNSYTTTPGSYFTFNFSGTGFTFNTVVNNRGGIWAAEVIETGDKDTISVWENISHPGALDKSFECFSLPNSTYTVRMTFLGDDPNNPPVGGLSRGWLKYSTTSNVTVNAKPTVYGVMNFTGYKDLGTDNTVLPSAINGKRSDAPSWVIGSWVPSHTADTPGATRNLQISIIADGIQISRFDPSYINTLTSKSLDQVSIRQVYTAYNFKDSTGLYPLWDGVATITVTKEKGVQFTHEYDYKYGDVSINSGYMAMFSSTIPQMSRMYISDTSYTFSIPVSNTDQNVKAGNSILYNYDFGDGKVYGLAYSTNLYDAFDYPSAPLYSNRIFTQTRPSGLLKTYYSFGFNRTIKQGEKLSLTSYMIASKIQDSADVYTSGAEMNFGNRFPPLGLPGQVLTVKPDGTDLFYSSPTVALEPGFGIIENGDTIRVDTSKIVTQTQSNDFVHKTGTETIAGSKTFSSAISVAGSNATGDIVTRNSGTGLYGFRTTAQVLSDIGAAPTTGGLYLPSGAANPVNTITYSLDINSLSYGSFFTFFGTSATNKPSTSSGPTLSLGTSVSNQTAVLSLPKDGTDNAFFMSGAKGGTWYQLASRAWVNSQTVPISRGGTNLTVLGSPYQELRVNAAGSALEYFNSSMVPDTTFSGASYVFQLNKRVATFTGTTSTFTLPALTGSRGYLGFIINDGTGNITINSNSGGNDIKEPGSSPTNTKTILPTEVWRIYSNGTYYYLSN